VEWASIEETFAGAGDDGAGGVLLLGNGFSTNIWSAFGYSTLLEQSGLSGRARELFGSRTSFETVLAELATARKVVGVVAPDREQLLERLGGLADEVREALFQTVREVHPEANRLVAGVKPKGVFGLVGGHVEVLKQVAIYLRRILRASGGRTRASPKRPGSSTCTPGALAPRSQPVVGGRATLDVFDKEEVPMASTSSIRLISVSTERSRRRVREVEQPIINITMQVDERRVFNVTEAAAILGIGRSKLYEFIAAGEIRTIHIGRLCKAPVAAIDEFLATRPSTPPRPNA